MRTLSQHEAAAVHGAKGEIKQPPKNGRISPLPIEVKLYPPAPEDPKPPYHPI
jgi:hypothetical protein